MKLNLNFDGFTKLRDWWNVVRSNFEIIEKECNTTRKIADNACTKEEARSYINEFIGLSDEYMAAIQAFTELYKENESTVASMDEVYGGRLKYYSKEEVFDANEAVGEDAMFFCKAETENTPENQSGILISKTDNKQMWIAEDGEIFYRQFVDDVWSEWISKLAEDIKETVEYTDGLIDYLNKSPITLQRNDDGSLNYFMQEEAHNTEPDNLNISCPAKGTTSGTKEILDLCSFQYVKQIDYDVPIFEMNLSWKVNFSCSSYVSFVINNLTFYMKNSNGDVVYETQPINNLEGGSHTPITKGEKVTIPWAKMPSDTYFFEVHFDYSISNENGSIYSLKYYTDINLDIKHNFRDIIVYPTK